MHEWALAESVVMAALAEAERSGLTRIERIEVSVGQLQQISEDVFLFAVHKVIPDTLAPLRDVEVRVTVEPAGFRCRACERGFALDDVATALAPEQAEAVHFIPELAHAFLRCPDCGSPDFEVASGRGVRLVEVSGS